MKRPAFQLYPNDWISSGSIALMTPAEEGAYIRLLCYAWMEDDCGLSDDDEQLAVLSRLGRAWPKSAARLRKQFDLRDGRLYNPRLLEVRAVADSWHSKQRDSGRRGAEKRWGSDGNPIPSPSSDNGDPMASPSPQNGEPIARASDSSSSSSSSSFSSSAKESRIASPKSGSANAHGSRFALTELPLQWQEWTAREMHWDAQEAERVFAKFADYWRAKAGAGGRKADWLATWRNWCRDEHKTPPVRNGSLQFAAPKKSFVDSVSTVIGDRHRRGEKLL